MTSLVVQVISANVNYFQLKKTAVVLFFIFLTYPHIY